MKWERNEETIGEKNQISWVSWIHPFLLQKNLILSITIQTETSVMRCMLFIMLFASFYLYQTSLKGCFLSLYSHLHLYPTDWKYCFYLHFSQTVVMRTTVSPLPNSPDTRFSPHLVQPVCDNWKWWILNLVWSCVLLCCLGHWLLTRPLCCPLFVILLVGTHFSIYLVFMSQKFFSH